MVKKTWHETQIQVVGYCENCHGEPVLLTESKPLRTDFKHSSSIGVLCAVPAKFYAFTLLAKISFVPVTCFHEFSKNHVMVYWLSSNSMLKIWIAVLVQHGSTGIIFLRVRFPRFPLYQLRAFMSFLNNHVLMDYW